VNRANTRRWAISPLAFAGAVTIGICSPVLQMSASASSSATGQAVPLLMRQAVVEGNNTTNPTTNIKLFSPEYSATVSTDLSVLSNGQISSASDQRSPTSSGMNGAARGDTAAAQATIIAAQVAMPGMASDGANGLSVKGNISGRALNGTLNESYFPGSTVTARVQAACASLSGRSGVVMIPATETSTDPGFAVEPIGCMVEDYRGILLLAGPGITQQPAPSASSGNTLRTYWGSSANRWQHFIASGIHGEAITGGLNNYNGSTGYKSSYTDFSTDMYVTTPGQHFIQGGQISNNSPGDTFLRGMQINDTAWSTAAGDEGVEGDTIYITAGMPALTATISSLSGSTLTMSCTGYPSCSQLGEQQPIVNTSRNIQNTGTATMSNTGSPIVTITGGTVICPSGTNPCSSNTQGGVGLFFEFTAETHGGVHVLMPVIAVNSAGTQLTLLIQEGRTTTGPTNTSWQGNTTTGAYAVYRGTTITAVPYTRGNFSAIKATVADPTRFQVGDSIMVPGGNNRSTRYATYVAIQNVPCPNINPCEIINAESQGNYPINYGDNFQGEFSVAPFHADWTASRFTPQYGVFLNGTPATYGYFRAGDNVNSISTEIMLCTYTHVAYGSSCINFNRAAGAKQDYWQIPNLEITGNLIFDTPPSLPGNISGNITVTPTAGSQGLIINGFGAYSGKSAYLIEGGGYFNLAANEGMNLSTKSGSIQILAGAAEYLDAEGDGYGVNIGTKHSVEPIALGSASSSTTVNGAFNIGTKTTFDVNGVAHQAGTAPTASAGTLTGTNAGGYISGLNAVSSVTITFANSGWKTWASCTANATATGSEPYVTSVLGLTTGVTFTFPTSYTGGMTYSCNGN